MTLFCTLLRTVHVRALERIHLLYCGTGIGDFGLLSVGPCVWWYSYQATINDGTLFSCSLICSDIFMKGLYKMNHVVDIWNPSGLLDNSYYFFNLLYYIFSSCSGVLMWQLPRGSQRHTFSGIILLLAQWDKVWEERESYYRKCAWPSYPN